MPEKKPEASQVVSVRLPHELLQRLDRYLDWNALYRGDKSSRNAAIRHALSSWLSMTKSSELGSDPHRQQQQFYHAYQSLNKRHEWVAIHRLRQLMPWSRERFDAVLEALRADHHVELERAEPGPMSEQTLQEKLPGPRPVLSPTAVAGMHPAWPAYLQT